MLIFLFSLIRDALGHAPSKQEVAVLDMGCGRGYLTFALHDYLVNQFPGKNIHSKGIDVRPKLVNEINVIAQSLGTTFDGLRFDQGTIEDALRRRHEQTVAPSRLDVVIALHACDTATDDALYTAVSARADVIVVAPCCHKQVRPQLDSAVHDHPLLDVLRHPIYRERLAETVTDSLRALLLEWAGYSVQVFEFVGGEHTQKNCMITAVRQGAIDERRQDDLTARIQHLATLHGIRQQKLAEWMRVPLSNSTITPSLTARSMPPL